MRRMAVALLIAVAALLPAATVGADPTQAVQGSFTVAFTAAPTSREDGQACFIEAPVRFAFAADLAGSFTAEVRIIKQGPCAAPARDTFHAHGVYTGEVLGQAGTFRLTFHGATDAQGNAEGELTIQGGTGALAGLHGRLTLRGQAGVGGTYTGAVRFAP